MRESQKRKLYECQIRASDIRREHTGSREKIGNVDCMWFWSKMKEKKVQLHFQMVIS